MNRILNSVLKQHRTVVQVCVGSHKNSATIGGKRDSFFFIIIPKCDCILWLSVRVIETERISHKRKHRP